MAADTTRLPSGVLIEQSLLVARPVGTLVTNAGVLYQSTNAVVATYVAITGALSGGGITGLKKRIQLADIQVAAVTTGGLFDAAIPANAMVLGAGYRVDAAPSGGGVASCTIGSPMDVGAPYNVIDGLSLEELVGAPVGYNLGLNGNQDFGFDNARFLLTESAVTPIWSVFADVNLNTLATFDVTFYWFYSVPVLALP